MKTLKSIVGFVGTLLPIAALAYLVAVLLNYAPNPAQLWAQAEPWLRPVLTRLGAIRAEDGVHAFNWVRGLVVTGSALVVIALILWLIHKLWVKPVAKAMTLVKSSEAEQKLQKVVSEEQKLFKLIADVYRLNPITSIGEAVSTLEARKARSEGQMRLLADYAGPILDGQRGTTVEASIPAIVAWLEGRAKEARAAADARAEMADVKAQLAAANTNNHNMQMTLQELIARETQILMAMSELVKASKGGNASKLAAATAKVEALEAELGRLSSLTQAAISGNRGNQQQPQPRPPQQQPRPNQNQGQRQPQPATP